MDQTKSLELSPADELLAELRSQQRTMPMILRPRLLDLCTDLQTWVQSVEARLAALDRMPSADALRVLTEMPLRSCGPTAEEVAARQRRECEGCDD